MMGAIQWTDGYVVNAMMYSPEEFKRLSMGNSRSKDIGNVPTGTAMPPNSPIRSLASGVPACLHLAARLRHSSQHYLHTTGSEMFLPRPPSLPRYYASK